MTSPQTLLAPARVTRGVLELDGTPTQPRLAMRVDTRMSLPGRRISYQDWVRALPGRIWDPDAKSWYITGIGDVLDPESFFADAALEVRYPQQGPLAGWRLSDLITPVAAVGDDGASLRVRPRLLGWEACRERLGWGAVWNKDDGWFELPAMDATINGQLRAGVHWPEGTLESSLESKRPPEISTELSRFGTALSQSVSAKELGGLDAIQDWVRLLPEEFGKGDPERDPIELFEYQLLGALGVSLGHNLIADSPGVGKTYTALAVAAIRHSKRTLVLCPPLVVTNWAKETGRVGVGGDDVVMIVPGRKMPALPEEGVVIAPDSTVAARESLQDQLIDWGADVMIVDEAHRLMTLGSKRSEAALRVGRSAKMSLPVTGTPMLASPHQLVPLLELSGHLGPVFGGRGPFLERYCLRDKRGKFSPRRANLMELNRVLNDHVWVRRLKQDVLPWLPTKIRSELPVRVKLTEYKQAHADVLDKIDAWIDGVVKQTGDLPDADEREQFVSASLALISQMRKAAGLCKIPAAIDWLNLHNFEPDTDGRFNRPLVVWTHHKEVTEAMMNAVPESVGRVGVIKGGTPGHIRDELVESFQDGRIAVLVCSITAAGVGITLTRGSDALFVETDWTPALIEQAEDRNNRIGSTSNLHATTMVAAGTLDEHIQVALHKKGLVLGMVYGHKNDVSVAGDRAEDLRTANVLLADLVDEQLNKAKREGKGRTAGEGQ